MRTSQCNLRRVSPLNVPLHGIFKQAPATWCSLRTARDLQRSTLLNVAIQRIVMRCKAMLHVILQHGMEWLQSCIARRGVTIDERCLLW